MNDQTAQLEERTNQLYESAMRTGVDTSREALSYLQLVRRNPRVLEPEDQAVLQSAGQLDFMQHTLRFVAGAIAFDESLAIQAGEPAYTADDGINQRFRMELEDMRARMAEKIAVAPPSRVQ